MDLGNILNKLSVTYDGRKAGGRTLRMPFYTSNNNGYAFYYNTENGNIYCNCDAYETEANKERVREVVNKYLKENP